MRRSAFLFLLATAAVVHAETTKRTKTTSHTKAASATLLPVVNDDTNSTTATNSTTTSSTTVSDSQYWHERYHGLLSMSAYGDYETECPKTFTQATLLQSFPTSTAAPWTILQTWGPTESGTQGYSVYVPEMDKVVMVFRGLYGWQDSVNMSAASLSPFYIDETRCGDNCTAHAGALTAYLEAKNATNDWAIVKQWVNTTAAQWSVTGHGFGGMIAQVAALDLGWRNLCHWSHSHGAARVFSPAAASLYDSLFQGEAGQRTVANNDIIPTIIPESEDFTFTLQGFHVYGTNTTYGMNYVVCGDSATNPNCLGGNSTVDHDFYYTPIGYCGNSNVSYQTAYQSAYEASESSEFFLTATSTWIVPTTTTTSKSTTTANAAKAVATSSAGVSTAGASVSSVSANADTVKKAGASTLNVGRVFTALLGVGGVACVVL